MLLEVKKIIVPPGQTVILQDINWTDFESILVEKVYVKLKHLFL